MCARYKITNIELTLIMLNWYSIIFVSNYTCIRWLKLNYCGKYGENMLQNGTNPKDSLHSTVISKHNTTFVIQSYKTWRKGNTQ